MAEINVSKLLSEMQALTSVASNGLRPPTAVTEQKGEFNNYLKDALDKVNEYQNTAEDLAYRFEHGDSSVSISEVMVALQKSNISLQAVTQVRNKVVMAYQEIMNMSV
jgi:flagellar hook-basal body complex protein FliE